MTRGAGRGARGRAVGRLIGRVALAIGLACAALPAVAQEAAEREPDPSPFLMLDTGMHVGPVTRIAADAAGLVVATGSSDKSVRLFAAEDGRTLRKVHLPLGADLIGAVTGLAISPDGGRILAATVSFDTGESFDEGSLYLIDTESGQLLGRVPRLPAAPTQIQYAPDGSRFAMALGAHGVEVRAATGERQFREGAQPVAALALSSDRLVTVSFDADLRWLDLATGVEQGSVRIRDAGQPLSLALSPDGGRVAVGYEDRPYVDVIELEAKRKTRLQPPDGMADGNLGVVAWTRGPEAWLVAGGTLQTLGLENVLLAWRDGRAGEPLQLEVGTDAVMDLAPLGEEGVVYATADPSWGRVQLTADGAMRQVARRQGERLDFREAGTRRFEVGRDGATVVFSDRDPRRKPFRFDLDALELTPDPPRAPELVTVDFRRLSARLGAWQYTTAPRLDGRQLTLERGERALAADISADGDRIVLGTDYRLRLYARDGKELATRRLASAAWMVAMVPDRPLLVAAHGDGTIRWYSLRDDLLLAELAGLFVHADGRRWVAWTADGMFAHSELGGEQLVGFQRNGTRRAPTGTWLGFDQAYRQFHDPDAVRRALREDDAWPTLAARERVEGLLADLALPAIRVEAYCPLEALPEDVTSRSAFRLVEGGEAAPPIDGAGCVEVAAVAAADRAAGLTRTVQLPPGTQALRVRALVEEGTDSVAWIDALIDGRNVGRVEPPAAARRSRGAAAKLVVERVVPIASDQTTLLFRASRDDGVAAESAPFRFERAGPPPDRGKTLFVLSVGVDAYEGEIPPLGYAVADAMTFADTVARAAYKGYASTLSIRLADGAATRQAVVDAMHRIAGEAQADDAVLIYLAGHGVGTADGNYVFVTSDVREIDGIAEDGLEHATLAALLAEIPAENVFLVLDTCYAGAFDLKGPANLAYESGYFVLAGSSSVEEALDSYNGENGVLAHAVKQGLLGAAASPDGEIDALQLGVYARRAVPKLAAEKRHRQSAVFKAAGGELREFPITAVAE
jgi:WD40 repeat protein